MACKGSGVRIPVPPPRGLYPRDGQALRGEPLDLSQLGDDLFEVYFLAAINFPPWSHHFGRSLTEEVDQFYGGRTFQF